MAEEKIINRVKKMMALANDSAASDGERENALRMSYALMAKHNLDMTDVQGKPTGPQESRVQVSSEFYARPWSLTICMAVAKMFFCKYYFSSRGKNMALHTFTGKESNAAAAEEVARILVASIRRESGSRMRLLNENTTWRRSFATGAAFKIQERVREMTESTAKIEGMSTGTALVLVDLRKAEAVANDQHLVSLGINLKQSKGRASGNFANDAYSAGRSFGAGLNLATTKKIS